MGTFFKILISGAAGGMIVEVVSAGRVSEKAFSLGVFRLGIVGIFEWFE